MVDINVKCTLVLSPWLLVIQCTCGWSHDRGDGKRLERYVNIDSSTVIGSLLYPI